MNTVKTEKKAFTAGIVLGIIGTIFSFLVPGVTYGTSIPGLVLSVKKSSERKTTCAFVLNITALSLACANSALAVCITMRGFFKKHTGQF